MDSRTHASGRCKAANGLASHQEQHAGCHCVDNIHTHHHNTVKDNSRQTNAVITTANTSHNQQLESLINTYINSLH